MLVVTTAAAGCGGSGCQDRDRGDDWLRRHDRRPWRQHQHLWGLDRRRGHSCRHDRRQRRQHQQSGGTTGDAGTGGSAVAGGSGGGLGGLGGTADPGGGGGSLSWTRQPIRAPTSRTFRRGLFTCSRRSRRREPCSRRPSRFATGRRPPGCAARSSCSDGSMIVGRSGYTATLLPSGMVLFAGGSPRHPISCEC